MEAWEEVEAYDLGRSLHWCSMKGRAPSSWSTGALGISPACSCRLSGLEGLQRGQGASRREAGMGQAKVG